MLSEALTVGVKVWIEYMCTGRVARKYEVVGRRTRTQIVLGDHFQRRFYRANLCEIGTPTTRIVAIATDEEISAFEIGKTAAAAREFELEAEFGSLKSLLTGYPFELERRGEKYKLAAVVTPAQMRAMVAAYKGVRRLQ